MHYLYEEHVQNGKRKRKPICHGLDKDKIYAAIKQWRHCQLQERKDEDEDIYTCNMRILDLRLEEGCHNRENGMYYVNWIIFQGKK